MWFYDETSTDGDVGKEDGWTIVTNGHIQRYIAQDCVS
jgi:hypothetical protein